MSRKIKYEKGSKTPFSFEILDSVDGELDFVERHLEANPDVLAWTKRHKIEIPYRNHQGKISNYLPDFLVRYKSDHRLHLIEVKGRHLADNTDTKLKAREGSTFCQRRGMVYKMEVY